MVRKDNDEDRRCVPRFDCLKVSHHIRISPLKVLQFQLKRFSIVQPSSRTKARSPASDTQLHSATCSLDITNSFVHRM